MDALAQTSIFCSCCRPAFASISYCSAGFLRFVSFVLSCLRMRIDAAACAEERLSVKGSLSPTARLKLTSPFFTLSIKFSNSSAVALFQVLVEMEPSSSSEIILLLISLVREYRLLLSVSSSSNPSIAACSAMSLPSLPAAAFAAFRPASCK